MTTLGKIRENWDQIMVGAGIVAAVMVAAGSFWGGAFVDGRIAKHVEARHAHSNSDIAVMQSEVVHIKESVDDMKDNQAVFQQELLTLLRTMPRE